MTLSCIHSQKRVVRGYRKPWKWEQYVSYLSSPDLQTWRLHFGSWFYGFQPMVTWWYSASWWQHVSGKSITPVALSKQNIPNIPFKGMLSMTELSYFKPYIATTWPPPNGTAGWWPRLQQPVSHLVDIQTKWEQIAWCDPRSEGQEIHMWIQPHKVGSRNVGA